VESVGARALAVPLLVVCDLCKYAQSLSSLQPAEVPRVCYINKLDRTGASFEKSYASILDRLSTKAVRLQIPVGAEADFDGVIDVLEMKAYKFEGEMGKETIAYDIPESYMADAQKYHDEIVERIVETDDALMNDYLEGKIPDLATLKKALRAAVCTNKIFPVLTGSSLKNKGVQRVLDAVVDYLPSPLDLPPATGTNPDTGVEETRPASDTAPFSALVFKLQVDPFVGSLAFFRVYSGSFEAGQTVYNVANNKKERVGRISRSKANWLLLWGGFRATGWRLVPRGLGPTAASSGWWAQNP
jgi:elongation factor G